MDGQRVTKVAQELLACAEEELPRWLHTHAAELTYELIQYIKEKYADTKFVRADPEMADLATQRALVVAEQIRDQEPLALALAHWARGNVLIYHDYEQAIWSYQQAHAGYLAARNPLTAALLAGNLVGPLAEVGKYAEAEACYAEAKSESLKQVEFLKRFLRVLEQNFGYRLHSQGRYSEALVAHEQALTLAAHEEKNIDAVAQVQINRSLTLRMMGRLQDAQKALLDAQHIIEHKNVERHEAASKDTHLLTARINLNWGAQYTAQGDPAEALHRLQDAEAIFRELNKHADVATVQLRRGQLFQRIGAYSSAIQLFQKAEVTFTTMHLEPMLGQTLVELASARRLKGQGKDLKDARNLLTRAETLWTRLRNATKLNSPQNQDTDTTLEDHALIQFEQEPENMNSAEDAWLAQIKIEQLALALASADMSTARTLIAASITVRKNAHLTATFQFLTAEVLRRETCSPVHFAAAQHLYSEARTYALLQGDRWLRRQASAGLGELFLKYGAPLARQEFETAADLDAQMRLTLSMAELKAGFHQQARDVFAQLIRMDVQAKQAAHALLTMWRAKSGLLLDLFLESEMKQSATPEEQTDLETLRQKLYSLRWRKTAENEGKMPDSWREASDPEIGVWENKLIELLHQRNQQHGFTEEHPYGQPTDVLDKMEADILLEYAVCGSDFIGVCANRTGFYRVVIVAGVDEVTRYLGQLKSKFSKSLRQIAKEQNAQVLEEKELLGQLYKLLIAPLLDGIDIKTNGQKLLLALDGLLWLLPFAALWDGKRYLCEQWEIEIIPSGALLHFPRSTNPDLQQPVVIAATAADQLAFGEGARAVASILQVEAWVDESDAIARLRTMVHAPAILHLAAHAIERSDAPLFSALQMSHEMLSVEQCYELSLDGTKLVVLSGCATASGLDSGGTLLAFQTALFVAGAQRVLSTLWEIDSTITNRWMEKFYMFHVQKGMNVPQALQQTQRALIAKNVPPAVWAVFMCTRR